MARGPCIFSGRLICNSRRDKKGEKALSTEIAFEKLASSCLRMGQRLGLPEWTVWDQSGEEKGRRIVFIKIWMSRYKGKLTTVRVKEKGTEVVQVFWLPLVSNDSKRTRKKKVRIC